MEPHGTPNAGTPPPTVSDAYGPSREQRRARLRTARAAHATEERAALPTEGRWAVRPAEPSHIERLQYGLAAVWGVTVASHPRTWVVAAGLVDANGEPIDELRDAGGSVIRVEGRGYRARSCGHAGVRFEEGGVYCRRCGIFMGRRA